MDESTRAAAASSPTRQKVGWRVQASKTNRHSSSCKTSAASSSCAVSASEIKIYPACCCMMHTNVMVTPTCSSALNLASDVIPFTNDARGKDKRTDCRCSALNRRAILSNAASSSLFRHRKNKELVRLSSPCRMLCKISVVVARKMLLSSRHTRIA